MPAVHEDSKEPGAEWTSGVEGIDAVERGHEALLHEVFGIFPVAQESPGDREGAALVAADQLTERPGVATLHLFDEPAFRSGRRGVR